MKCHCKPGRQRDNCPDCEGTGERIDFAAIRREAIPRTAHDCLPGEPASNIKSARIAGRYRTPDGKTQIEWELEPGENGPKFSASGDYDRSSGQNLDEIARAYPGDAMVQRIHKVWSAYHLNDMKAGTPEQEAEIERREKLAAVQFPEAVYRDGTLNYYRVAELSGLKKESKFSSMPGHYDLCLSWLKEAGLYEVPLTPDMRATGGFPDEIWRGQADREKARRGGFWPQVAGLNAFDLTDAQLMEKTGKRGYRYGERWLYRAIPDEVLAEIKSWSEAPQPVGSLADHKTRLFLENNGIACRITRADAKPAPWDVAGHHYRVTLSGHRRRFTFDFWGSAHDAAENVDPSAASILSCVASDINTPETFEDFCAEYGDSSDSIKAKQTFTRANRHAKRLREFFTEQERAQLEGLR